MSNTDVVNKFKDLTERYKIAMTPGMVAPSVFNEAMGHLNIEGIEQNDDINEKNIIDNLRNINNHFMIKFDKIKINNMEMARLTENKNTFEKYLEMLKNKENMFKDIKDVLSKNPDLKCDDIFSNERHFIEETNTIKIISQIQAKIDNYSILNSNIMREYTELKKIVINNLDENLKDTINKDMICTICIDKKINTCATPCGHTYCGDCAKKMKNKCFICNTKIASLTKLFILGNDENNDNASADSGNIVPANGNLIPSLDLRDFRMQSEDAIVGYDTGNSMFGDIHWANIPPSIESIIRNN